jgi:hypothetical protein
VRVVRDLRKRPLGNFVGYNTLAGVRCESAILCVTLGPGGSMLWWTLDPDAALGSPMTLSSKPPQSACAT